jgi:ABC-type xylose transport system substrate-binding protein
VYAANDGQAGGVVAALTGAGVKPDALPPITGQDAELAAIQRIVAGQQAMTIYKPIPIEAEKAAELAVALVNGDKPSRHRRPTSRASSRSSSTRSSSPRTTSRTPSSRTASTAPPTSAPPTTPRLQGGLK